MSGLARGTRPPIFLAAGKQSPGRLPGPNPNSIPPSRLLKNRLILFLSLVGFKRNLSYWRDFDYFHFYFLTFFPGVLTK